MDLIQLEFSFRAMDFILREMKEGFLNGMYEMKY